MPTPPIPTDQPIGQLNCPLAIVGMSCRVPGADGLDEFWRMLQSGASAIERMPDSVENIEVLKAALLERLQTGRPKREESGKPYVHAGFAAALISRALGLTGAHMPIGAACASSLAARALGAASLQTGQSDFAIVGGASFNKSDSMILFSSAQSCSASGSRPFDAAADGLISSEGYVAIVLKTLERALSDGDRVHAVVRGIGISSDGRGKSLWAPHKEDTQMDRSPAEVVENLWRALSIPSYDTEMCYQRGVRRVMRAVRQPVNRRVEPIPHVGTWVCTGGARGITAYVAEQLATRYDLKIHLLC